MRDATAQLAQRLHFLCLRERRLRVDKLLLPLPRLGNVARNLREAAVTARCIRDAVDDDTRPEPASVFAHAPAFRLVSTLVSRGREGVLRKAGLAVFVGVEARKMLPDGFGRSITFD